MIIETAIVIGYQNGIADLKCQTQSACGSCSAKKACGTSLLPELTGEKGEQFLQIETITPLKIGQQVQIGLSENSFLTATLLLYAIPLINILFITILMANWQIHELIKASFIFITTFICYFAIRVYLRKNKKIANQKPVLLKVL